MFTIAPARNIERVDASLNTWARSISAAGADPGRLSFAVGGGCVVAGAAANARLRGGP